MSAKGEQGEIKNEVESNIEEAKVGESEGEKEER